MEGVQASKDGETNFSDQMAEQAPRSNRQQPSRSGRSAITFFVRQEAKPKIRAALADAGYGCSYQEGLVQMLKALLIQQGRDPKI